MTTNIKDYSTTQASNISLNGIDVNEGMLPSNLNNALRALMKNTRDWANDSQWFEYGDGSGAYTSAWVSTTQFTIASGVDISAIYHVGRRLKVLKADNSLVYGSIAATSNNGTLQTVTATFDSGNLGSSSNALRIYIGGLSKTNSSIPAEIIVTTNIADNAVTTAKILDNNVTVAKMADNSVDSDQYVNGSIDTIHIADAQITTAKITDANVTTAKITDANVTTAKVANDAITLAKMASGTDGNIISYDASGNPVAIATGSDGQVLTSTGAGSAPAFEDAGGGEWTKLSHVTASNDATVVFNSSLITSTYQDYKIVYSNIHAASDRQNFELRASIDNGTNITNFDYMNRLYKQDENVSSRGDTDNAVFRLHGNETSGNAAGESLSGFIEIFDPSATDTRKHILGRTVFNLGDSGVVHFHSLLGGSTRVTNAVNYLRFNWASGNIASGEFTLYGRKI